MANTNFPRPTVGLCCRRILWPNGHSRSWRTLVPLCAVVLAITLFNAAIPRTAQAACTLTTDTAELWQLDCSGDDVGKIQPGTTAEIRIIADSTTKITGAVGGTSVSSNTYFQGIFAKISSGEKPITITVEEGAVIKSSDAVGQLADGVKIETLGTGALTVVNAGEIIGRQAGDGISAEAGAAESSGDIEITNTGTVTGGNHGIDVLHIGTGKIVITNSGTVNGELGSGIRAIHSGVFVADDITDGVVVTSSGTIAAAGIAGILAEVGSSTVILSKHSVRVDVTGGEITSTIDAGGKGFGILARNYGLGGVAVTVGVPDDGSTPEDESSAAKIGTVDSKIARHGVHAGIYNAENSQSVHVTLHSGSEIHAAGIGIWAGHNGVYAGEAIADGVVVTSSGTIAAAGLAGILAELGSSTVILSKHSVRVDVTGGEITSTIDAGGKGFGILARNYGLGGVAVTVGVPDDGSTPEDESSAAKIGTVESKIARHGVHAVIYNAENSQSVHVTLHSGSEIHARGVGIWALHQGLYAGEAIADGVVVTSSGTIAAAGVAGIFAEVGTSTVTGSKHSVRVNVTGGEITTTGEDENQGDGVVARTYGLGGVAVTVGVPDDGSTPEDESSAAKIGTAESKITKRGINAAIFNAGNSQSVHVTLHSGSEIHTRGIGIWAWHLGLYAGEAIADGVVVTSSGTIAAAGLAGIFAELGSPTVTDSKHSVRVDVTGGEITSTNDEEGHGDGILARNYGLGGVMVTVGVPDDGSTPEDESSTAKIGTAKSKVARHGVYAIVSNAENSQSVHVTLHSGSEIHAGGFGISALHKGVYVGEDIADGVVVTSSGTIAAAGRAGIFAVVGTSTFTGSKHSVRVDVAGGEITSTSEEENEGYGVFAHNYGLGGVAVTVGVPDDGSTPEDQSSVAKIGTVESKTANSGVYAGISNNDNAKSIVVTVHSHSSVRSQDIGIFARHFGTGSTQVEIAKGATVQSGTVGEKAASLTVNGISVSRLQAPAGEATDRIKIDGTVNLFGGKFDAETGGGAGVYLSHGGEVVIGATGSVSADSGIVIAVGNKNDLALDITLGMSQIRHRISGKIINPGDTTIRLRRNEGDDYETLSFGQKFYHGVWDIIATKVGTEITITDEVGPRAQIYEAIPSVLLSIDGLTGFESRLKSRRNSDSTPTGADGLTGDAWFSVNFSGGARSAEKSTYGSHSKANTRTAYDFSQNGFAAGIDVPVGDSWVAGVSFHHNRVSAVMGNSGGSIKISGTGIGVSGTFHGDGYYIGAQAATTRYKAGLTADANIAVASDISGSGRALGFEVGTSVEVGKATLTPRFGLNHSTATLNNFASSRAAGGGLFSMGKAEVTSGRVGIRAESSDIIGGDLFATLDLEHDISSSGHSVQVDDTTLQMETETTRVRVGAGGSAEWDDGRSSLHGSIGLSFGGDDQEYSTGIGFTFAF